MEDLFLKLNRHENRSGISVFLLGEVQSINKLEALTEQEILVLYREYGKNLYNYLDGIYTAVVVDEIKKKLFVFQDFFGCNRGVYFFINNNSIVISNKLKNVVLNMKESLTMNNKSVQDFITYGYIPNKQTLIKNILKIPGKKYLEIDLNSFKFKLKKMKYKFPPTSKEITADIYDKVFENSCKSCMTDNLATTISSGYDSNYILYTLRNNSKEEISAFCIGGVIGRNEISVAKNICATYENVNFYSKIVDGSSFNKYPEIVWALEGAVYECGIFLQYELAKLVSEKNIKQIILGECADQVLDYEIYHPVYAIIEKLKFTVPKTIRKLFKHLYFKPYKDVYDMASYKVLKKNGILLNYFGIEGKYPFLNREFLSVAKMISKKTDKSKSFHKSVVKSLLKEDVGQMLNKLGGATELKALFVGDITFEELQDFCKRSRYYKSKQFDDKYYSIDYLMKILYLELFKNLFVNQRCEIEDISQIQLVDFMRN